MTVKELVELNQMITDITITIRKNGSALLDELNIGLVAGIKPPYPTMVPKDESYIGNISTSTKREASYINKSVNAWDDGKEYWKTKTNIIPEKWLGLEVCSWSVYPASTATNGPSRRNDFSCTHRNVNFHGQQLHITALPSGERLIVEAPEDNKCIVVENQISFDDMMNGGQQ